MRAGVRRADESGLAVPSWVALVSLAAVAVAILAFFITGSSDPEPTEASAAGSDRPSRTVPPTDAPSSEPADKQRRPQPHPKDREPDPPSPQAYVEVYNNSTVSGLAAQTASELQDAGWNVVGTDNWYGNIPANTVYYPERLRDQARLLARELGVERVRPAVSPMRFDRLTVILTTAA